MFYTLCIAIEDWADVHRELSPFAQWRDLGVNLGLSIESLEQIKLDQMTCREQLREVLVLWLKQYYSVDKYGLPSWSQLSDAVEPIDRALATTIKERHLLESQPQSKNSIHVCFD